MLVHSVRSTFLVFMAATKLKGQSGSLLIICRWNVANFIYANKYSYKNGYYWRSNGKTGVACGRWACVGAPKWGHNRAAGGVLLAGWLLGLVGWLPTGLVECKGLRKRSTKIRSPAICHNKFLHSRVTDIATKHSEKSWFVCSVCSKITEIVLLLHQMNNEWLWQSG